jgi:hypothetical protein
MIHPLAGLTSSIRRGWLTPRALERIVRDILGPLAIEGDGVRIQHESPGSAVIDAQPLDDVVTIPFRVRKSAFGLQVQPGIVRCGQDGSQWFLPPVGGLPMLSSPHLQIPTEVGYVTIRYSKDLPDGGPTNLPWPIMFVPLGELKEANVPADEPVLADLVLARVLGFGEVIEQWREGMIEIP